MPQILSKSAAALALLSLGAPAFSTAVHAANPPSTVRPAPHANPEVKRLQSAALQALKQGNVSLATIQLKNALRLDPDNGTLRAQLGLALLEGGDAVAAEREVRQARINGAKDQDAVPTLLQAMVARGEFSDVLAQFPEPAPDDKSKLAVVTLRARSQASQATGDPAAAVAEMDRSLAIQRDAVGLLGRARLALLQNQTDLAMKYIDQSLAMAHNNSAALMMKAAIVRVHDKNAALNILNGVIKTNPNSLNAIVARIELLLEMRRVEEAQQAVDGLVAKAPNLPIANFYKAVLLGLHNKALDGWRIAQSLPSEFLQVNERIAIAASQLAINSGNLESANSLLTTFVGQHAAASEARTRLAALRLRMNNPAYALEIMQPLLDSRNPVVLQLIGAIYARLGQPPKALEYMRKARAAGSKDSTLASQVALADLAQNNTAQGVQETLTLLKQKPGNPAPAIGGVDILVRQAKFAEAQTLADQADKLSPKSPVPAFLKGQILFAQHKPDAALPFINQALQRDPHYEPALFARAQIALGHRKFADAVKDLKQAQTLYPKNPLSYVKLAEVAAVQNQQAQSLALLKRGIAVAPKQIGTRVVLARYQISQKKLADALATLKDALHVAPNDPQCLALLGQVQQALGQKAAALGTNKALTQKYQQSGAAQALLGNSLLANGDKKGAAAAYKRATELSPDVAQYFTALINLQMDAGDKKGAVATAQGWAANHKGPDGAVLLAQTLIHAQRLPEAASVVAKAQAIRPDWQLTILESQIVKLRGDRARGLSILKTWLSDHSTDVPVRQAYGDMLLVGNDNAAALAQYEIILKTNADNAGVLNNTAWLLRDSNPARALALASAAAKLQPNSADIADTMGWILLQKKDAKGALPVLQRAHAIGPGNRQITYHLALAFDSLGRKAEAKQALEDALAKGGDFPDAADARKLLKSL